MPHFQWNGYKIRYEVHGHGPGPVVVLVHGWAQSSRCWDQLVPVMRTRHQLVCIDLPGFGGSEKPSRFSYALEDLAVVMTDFLEHVKFPRVVLVGHSMGGVVSLLASILEPDRVQGLILINTPVQGPSRPLQLFRSVVFPEFWFELGKNMGLAMRLANLVTVGRFDVRGLYAMQDAGRASSIAASRTYDRLTRLDLRRAARAIKVPTLVIGCDNDNVVPVQAAHLMASLVPHSSLTIMSRMQHMPMVEDPTRLASILHPFLRRLETEGPGAGPGSGAPENSARGLVDKSERAPKREPPVPPDIRKQGPPATVTRQRHIKRWAEKRRSRFRGLTTLTAVALLLWSTRPGAGQVAEAGCLDHLVTVSGHAVRVLYTPPRSPGAPVVIDLHGSGWHVDNNVDCLRRWQRYGFTGLDVEYTQDVDPASVEEVLAAISWIQRDLTPRALGLHGYSLGARVAFQVGVVCPTLNALSGMSGRVVLWDGQRPVLDRADRIHCPVLIQHGANDTVVPVENAEMFADALHLLGRNFEYWRYAETGHRLDLVPVARLRAETFMQRCLGATPEAGFSSGGE